MLWYQILAKNGTFEYPGEDEIDSITGIEAEKDTDDMESAVFLAYMHALRQVLAASTFT